MHINAPICLSVKMKNHFGTEIEFLISNKQIIVVYFTTPINVKRVITMKNQCKLDYPHTNMTGQFCWSKESPNFLISYESPWYQHLFEILQNKFYRLNSDLNHSLINHIAKIGDSLK
jgi:hypothetical protein